MTSKAAGLSKQDQKYMALIAEYQRELKVIFSDLKRSRAEFKRTRKDSTRRLAEIDSLLGRV
ncbi:MAG: hypothetical protein FD161_3521 [Limisphaerales bacterium]|nr:MAG: hypothetical protein FD161_3521 [Limisphaerales bacterium]KAG0507654.1 MAG: hypothetical protein E1N63_3187 [Limisphaerales bacterium]TXT51773.1 MAG: hypothetical protein FD140_1414 [Limisphaerales bacterium]